MFIELGAVAAFLAVLLGAFGAHGLRGRLTPDLLAVYQTGVQYQMYHALGLLAVGILAMIRPGGAYALAGWFFVGGIVVFSGSLYALAITGYKRLGAVTPLGGLFFLAGWVTLTVAVLH